MRFVIVGFSEETGVRIFTFEGIAEDRTRTEFTVRADLSLTRRYGIPMQELPLLCKGVLERRGEDEKRAWTFTEEDMHMHADWRTAAREAAATRAKSMRRPPSNRLGSAWRTTPQFASAAPAVEGAAIVKE